MRERPRLERWRLFGLLLPRDVRERVFEPALGDLAREWLTSPTSRRPAPFAFYAVGTFLGCVPPTLVRPFVRSGRLTCLGRATVWTLVFLAATAVLVRNLREGYAAGGS